MLEDKIRHIYEHPEVYFTQEAARKRGYICPVCENGSGSDGTGVKLIREKVSVINFSNAEQVRT